MAPVYSQTSLTDAATQLGVRLNDPDHIYWPIAEVYALLIESLRIFQALTGFYRERVTFPTVAGTAFYDLRSLFASEYAFTITDTSILAEIQRHLVEPVANPWTGTAQFSITDISEALQTIRDDFALDTGIYASRATIAAASPPTSRIALAQTVIDIRRAAWKDTASGLTYPMVRTDEYAANAYQISWPTPTRPYAYSIVASPPVTVQLIPPAVASGTLDLCLIPSGPLLPLNPASPVVIGIPDDLCWGVTWGALSCLLAHDGPSKDVPRGTIAGQLHQLAVVAARSPVSSLVMQISSVPLGVESLDDLDRYSPSWLSTSGRPSFAAFVSANLFALSPVPDAIYTVSLDLARSFPIPDTANPSTTYLQVGYELVDPILDMAQYLASFKEGASEIELARPLFQRFLGRCGYMNQRLRANATYNQLLNQPAQRQSIEVPRVMEEVKSGAD